jgi:hypothetical protein
MPFEFYPINCFTINGTNGKQAQYNNYCTTKFYTTLPPEIPPKKYFLQQMHTSAIVATNIKRSNSGSSGINIQNLQYSSSTSNIFRFQ